MLALERSEQPGVDGIAVSSEMTAAAWDAYVTRHPDATAYHRSMWRWLFEKTLGHDTLYLAATRDARIVGVVPLVAMKSWLFARAFVALPFLIDGGRLCDHCPPAA